MSQVLPLMPEEVNDASSETSIWREAEAAQIGSGDVDAAEAHSLTALEHAVRLAARINSNAHGMRDTEGRNSDVAIGVFPQFAMFNHSCRPNCAFTFAPGSRAMEIRCLSPVPPSTELTVAYIDLYQTTPARRKELQATKHFWCNCVRCGPAADPMANDGAVADGAAGAGTGAGTVTESVEVEAAVEDVVIDGMCCPLCTSCPELLRFSGMDVCGAATDAAANSANENANGDGGGSGGGGNIDDLVAELEAMDGGGSKKGKKKKKGKGGGGGENGMVNGGESGGGIGGGNGDGKKDAPPEPQPAPNANPPAPPANPEPRPATPVDRTRLECGGCGAKFVTDSANGQLFNAEQARAMSEPFLRRRDFGSARTILSECLEKYEASGFTPGSCKPPR